MALNPIVLENQLQGTPREEWDLQFRASTNIEGFATDISLNRGDTIEFKINSNDDYRIDIYRLGYYGGDGARLVDTIDNLEAFIQPDPIRVAETGLVDAGNWTVSASWGVPADVTSGVFLAKLTRADGTGDSHIPFIVRADGYESDIVFQTSDTTWQAYNTWGSIDADGNGASLYGGDEPPDRAYAVSYNRPFVTRTDGPTGPTPWNWVLGQEFSAIYWLEQNGYDVSYISGVDTDRFGSSLLDHEVFLSAGHDEYWSGAQRANVEAARDAGVNLAFWTANEVYWRTRWEDSVDGSDTPYRTLVTYKESFVGDIDPSDEWTGTFRDGRFSSPTAVGGGIPENALVGSLFGAGYNAEASSHSTITIPYDMSQLRLWRDTAVADTVPGEEYTLGQNLLTYEWNVSPDNGFRPAGLIPLSSTTVTIGTPEIVNDYGTNSFAGEATHNITLYRSQESGALVFGAGTAFWSFGLSGDWDADSGVTESAEIQQAMVNLFAEMGVQPETLQQGLVLASASNDFVAPTTTIAIEGNVGVAEEGQVVVIRGTATDDDANASTEDGKVAAIEVSVNGGVTWHVAEGTTDWTYYWDAQDPGEHIIMARAIDDSLNLQYVDVGSANITVESSGTVAINGFVGDDSANFLWGGTGQDWMFAGDGVDELVGGYGNDFLYGQGGQDWIFSGVGIDFASGDEGNDFLFGQEEQDWLYGGTGLDVLHGDEGNDLLYGQQDEDWLYGGEGHDLLNGGDGNDFLEGGPGEDTFAFDLNSGNDVITDFERGVDHIDLSAYGFGSFNNIEISSATNYVTISLDSENHIEVGVNQLTANDFIL